GSLSTSQTATDAPSPASLVAVAAPMPLPAPVTTATFSVNLIDITSLVESMEGSAPVAGGMSPPRLDRSQVLRDGSPQCVSSSGDPDRGRSAQLRRAHRFEKAQGRDGRRCRNRLFPVR